MTGRSLLSGCRVVDQQDDVGDGSLAWAVALPLSPTHVPTVVVAVGGEAVDLGAGSAGRLAAALIRAGAIPPRTQEGDQLWERQQPATGAARRSSGPRPSTAGRSRSTRNPPPTGTS